MQLSNHPDLMTKADLADLVGISVHTVEKWNTRGFAPKRIHLGRRVFYRKTDVAEWLNSLETSR